jgi:hypothetical protein
VLDAEIAELQQKFDGIKAKRDDLDSMIAEHRRLLSPFRRIPDNLLKTVFINCLRPEGNAPMTIHEAPLLLGYVCRRWRAVAYDTPYLWATLHVGYIPPPIVLDSLPEAEFTPQEHPITPQVQSHLHAVLEWLNRSGTRPLSLSMHPSIGVANFHLYLPILSSFSHRWYSVELTANHEAAIYALSAKSSDAFPMLEALTLTFANWLDTDPELQWKIESGILNAPNLRSVAVHYFPFTLGIMDLDWSCLTSLVLCDSSSAARRSTPDEAFRVFSHCTNLVRLTIAIYDPSPEGVWFAPSHFHLPYLESLSVNDQYHYLSTLFDCIHAPALNRVSYSTPLWPSAHRPSPLVALLSRNGQSVRTLTTDPRSFTCANITACMRATPNLAKFVCKASRLYGLDVQYSTAQRENPIMANIMRPVFHLLVPPTDEGACRWPRLQAMECAIPGSSEEDVLKFVRERMEAAARMGLTLDVLPLREIRVSFGYTKKIDLPKLREEYIRGGLRLEFFDYWEVQDESIASPGRFDPRAGIKSGDSSAVIPF